MLETLGPGAETLPESMRRPARVVAVLERVTFQARKKTGLINRTGEPSSGDLYQIPVVARDGRLRLRLEAANGALAHPGGTKERAARALFGQRHPRFRRL